MYPQILGTLSQELIHIIPKRICQTLSDEFMLKNTVIRQTPSDELQTDEYEPINRNPLSSNNRIITSISFSHFVELIKISDELKRKFYELLILKTTLSVSELKRQISTLTYERLGLSGDYEKAFSQIQQKITPEQNTDIH